VHGGTGNGNWDRHARRRRTIRVAAPLAVPMALGLTLGVVLAVSSGPPVAHITQTLGAHKKAGTTQGKAPAAESDPDCMLIVPPDPLSARGLATPYQLTGPHGMTPAQSGCTESNPNAGAFVQATILDPRTGRLYTYEPLVVTRGTAPAAASVLPSLPAGAVTDIMVGFNGGNLTIAGTQPDTGHCVNGMGTSVFSEVSYCNSAAFYRAAQRAEAEGKLVIPATGVSSLTGQPCPTSRSFDIVDQDPSDNVTTEYLLTRGGRTAQDNLPNARALPGAVTLVNGSDNALLDDFVLPALGCRPFTAPDLSAGGRPGTSQTLDELSAAADQRSPVALVPENDPMTLLNGQISTAKTNLYRLGVDQPQVSLAQTADSPVGFCMNILNIQTPFLADNASRLSATPSPVPSEGTNLLTFMAARLSASFANLGCGEYGLKDTVQLALDGRGVPAAVTLVLDQQEPR
jgi:hypothetical protein